VTSLADTPVNDRARSTVLVALRYISPACCQRCNAERCWRWVWPWRALTAS